MKPRWHLRQWAASAVLGLVCATSAAAPVRLDDAGTYIDPPQLQLQWRTLAQGGNARLMEGRARLNLRLDTQRYVGRTVRVHLTMSPVSGAGLVMQWQAQSRLLPGRITPGERVLVYRGVIPGVVLEDQLMLQLSADGDWLGDTSRLQFHFELETE